MPPVNKKRKKKRGGAPYSDKKKDYNIEEKIEELQEYEGDEQPFEKNFLKITPQMEAYSEDQITNYRTSKGVALEGEDLPSPILKFTDYEFPEFFMNEVEKQKFEIPTPIQAQSWPICLSGRDLIGIARTGSGKTLAYLLPALIHIQNQPPLKEGDGPIAVVLAPTRELAQQIYTVAQEFGSLSNIKSTCIFGGVSKGPQIRDWMKGSEICIATPGRLIDLLKSTEANLNRCTYLCLDEADRMLDMGFEPQIRGIIQGTRSDRQTLMFSATWPKEVQDLAKDYLDKAVVLRIGSNSLSANHNILQIVDVCVKDLKQDRLIALLGEIFENVNRKVLIFVLTKQRADLVTNYLKATGWPAMSLHGDKSQEERDRVLACFRHGKAKILVATDVAARGLDVDDISFVINYDFPISTEDYVHRIGRTGRSDKKGNAYTFFTTQESKHAQELIDILTEAKQKINPLLFDMLTKQGRANFHLYAGGVTKGKRKQ